MRLQGNRTPAEFEDFIQMIPVIEEVERRLQQLVSRGDSCIAIEHGPEGSILSIMAEIRPTTVMKWHNDQLYVAWNGRKALNKDSDRIWLIDLFSLTKAVDELRTYMILDDLSDL